MTSRSIYFTILLFALFLFCLIVVFNNAVVGSRDEEVAEGLGGCANKKLK